MKAVAVILVMAILISGCFGASARKRAAQLEYEKGMRLYNRCEYKAAKKAFAHAVWLNPNHASAQQYLSVVKRTLGEPIDLEP